MIEPSTHLSILQAMLGAGEAKEEAWIAFSARYRHFIISWCLKRRVPRGDAEDMAQEILRILFQKLAKFDPDRKFRPWLSTVIRNAVTSLYHRKFTAENKPVGGDYYQLIEQLQSQEAADELAASVDGYTDPVLEASLAAVKERVEEKTWIVFQETVVKGRKVADVAKDVRLTTGAAHTAKRRATTMLKEEYQRRTTPPAAGEACGNV